jgi:hypothetical protein
MRLFQFFIGGNWKFLFENWNKYCIPVCIDDRLMSKHRIAETMGSIQYKDYENQYGELYTYAFHIAIYRTLAITVPALIIILKACRKSTVNWRIKPSLMKSQPDKFEELEIST